VAILLVQSAQKGPLGGVNNTTLAFDVNVTAGNLLVVSQQHYLPVDQPASLPTDTLGHTYVEAVQQFMDFTGDGCRLATWYVQNCSGGANTVTFDMGGTATNGSLACTIAEFSGLATTSVLDQTAAFEASVWDAFPTTPGVVTTQASELLYGAMMFDGGVSTMEPGGSYTQVEEIEAAPLSVIYKTVASTGTYVADWTLTGGGDKRWMCHIATFKAATGGASAALSGTATSGMTEADVVSGGKVITVTLSGTTWIPS
jgi:hypothetical protein